MSKIEEIIEKFFMELLVASSCDKITKEVDDRVKAVFKKYEKAIQSLLKEQYQKGFIDGSDTTAEQANEIHAVKLNEVKEMLAYDKKEILNEQLEGLTNFYKGYMSVETKTDGCCEIDGEPMSWGVAKIEVEANTKVGKKVLEELKNE